MGKETAVRLAQLGADVTIACRNPDRAVAALEDIRMQAPAAKVNYEGLGVDWIFYCAGCSGRGAISFLVPTRGSNDGPEGQYCGHENQIVRW